MKKFIKEFKPKDKVESVFLLKRKEVKKTKTDKPYLAVSLCDTTGSIEGRAWDNAAEMNEAVEAGQPVFVSGEVDSWRENIQLRVNRMRPAGEGEYEKHDLIRSVADIEGIFGKVKAYLSEVKSRPLSKLIEQFLGEADFVERFKRAPGALNWHNAYAGGLLEHTYEVMFIADKTCSLYPQADRELCMVGAFLHDIGKIYEIDPQGLEYTVAGGMIGHLSLGFEVMSKKIDAVKNFPDDLALHLKHAVLSHHGEYEQQSPVLPKTLEATIIYHADSLVSQANAVKEIIEAQSSFPRTWSNYITIKNRKYLLSRPEHTAGEPGRP